MSTLRSTGPATSRSPGVLSPVSSQAADCSTSSATGQPPTLGIVNKVLTHSLVDGPGNRAVVFLQGCNLRCLFCHNPQTLVVCNNCGLCVESCPVGALSRSHGSVLWDQTLCRECEACTRACPHGSSPRVRHLTAQQLWQEVEPVSAFLSGVTVSGGEPTEQLPFLISFLSVVKAASGLSTLVETNGCVSQQDLASLLPVMDSAMVDLKAMDADVHLRLTGQSNALTQQTIRTLSKHGKLHAVRVTVVPGFTDLVANAAATARFLRSIDPQIRLRFLRFRAHGTRGPAVGWASPTDVLMDEMVAAAACEGLLNVSRSM